VAVMRLWIDPSSTSCCLAMCTLTPCIMQCSSISNTCRVERAMRLISAKSTASPACTVSVNKRPTARSRQARRPDAVSSTNWSGPSPWMLAYRKSP
jgi:hypothetical protein